MKFVITQYESGVLIEVVRVRGELQLLVSGVLESRSQLYGVGYPEYFSLMPASYKSPNILILGLGGGSICKIYEDLYQDYHIDVVDNSEAIIFVAKKYFRVQESNLLKIYHEDACRFVATSTKEYDLIIVDVFNGDTIPAHLLTEEFFSHVNRLLKVRGALALNVSGATTMRNLGTLFSILSSFQFSIFLLITPNQMNIIVYCFKENISRDEFANRLHNSVSVSALSRRKELQKITNYIETAAIAIKNR